MRSLMMREVAERRKSSKLWLRAKERTLKSRKCEKGFQTLIKEVRNTIKEGS